MTLWDEPVWGDLWEEYLYSCQNQGRVTALKWLLYQWLRLAARIVTFCIHRSYDMLKSYIKTASRNFSRHKSYTAINLVGLTAGLTACFLIATLIFDDLSFDRYHEHRDTVYRLYLKTSHSGTPFLMAPTSLPLAPAIKDELPDVMRSARISENSVFPYAVRDKIFRDRLYFVDAEILEILSLPLLYGQVATVLSEPNSVVITRAQSRRFFGDENPVGQTIELDRGKQYVVTGVFDAWPDNTHLRPAAMASIESQYDNPHGRWDDWTSFANDYTYIRLVPGADPALVEQKLNDLLRRHLEENEIGQDGIFMQPLTDIHFSSLNYDSAVTSDRQWLVIFSVIGSFILVIASFNFINLTTARISIRSREVGVRKVAGAQKNQLFRQFMVESLSLSVMAGLFAVLLAAAALPAFGQLLRRHLSAGDLFQGAVPMVALLLMAGVGMLAGFYPALRLAGIGPLAAFHSQKTTGKKLTIRTFLVVLQFAISIMLIVATLTIQRQRVFMLNKPLGFDTHQLVSVVLRNTPFHGREAALKEAALSLPGVEAVSFSHSVPASGISTASNYQIEGSDEDYYLSAALSDGNLVNTLGFSLLEGRHLRENSQADAESSVLINETAARLLGWEQPVNKVLLSDGNRYQVVGVVKDAHFESMHYAIDPMLFRVSTRTNFMTLRVDPKQMDAIAGGMEQAWKAIIPGGHPFQLFYFDEAFARYYRGEKRMTSIFTICAALAIILSCMGMLALAAFVVDRRLKELGIRKVLGASAISLMMGLSAQFVRWVLAAAAMALPLAYWGMGHFLRRYPYRTGIPWWLLLAAVGTALTASLISVGAQTWRAARVEPARILKHE